MRPVRASVARIVQKFYLTAASGVDRCAERCACHRIRLFAAQDFVLLAAGDRRDWITRQAHEPLIYPLYPALRIGDDDGAARAFDNGEEPVLPLGGPIAVGSLALQAPDDGFHDDHHDQSGGEHLGDGPH